MARREKGVMAHRRERFPTRGVQMAVDGGAPVGGNGEED
jgi:hypothetical protein